jgi:hypothetical protein
LLILDATKVRVDGSVRDCAIHIEVSENWETGRAYLTN